MHPKIVFPGDLEPIIRDLTCPVHSRAERNRKRHARKGAEIDLSKGYRFEAGDWGSETHLEVVLDDLRQFLSAVLTVQEIPGGYPIRLSRNALTNFPREAHEAYGIRTTRERCDIQARDLDGLRRAVFRLEDEMLLRRAPILPLGKVDRWTKIAVRISRSPIAPYRWLSGWELEDENDYYPEAYLNRLAHCGVNGIWVAGLFRNLVASEIIPELGPKEHRLGKLRQLVEKAARYGIKVYFFCMEPRALPSGHPASVAHPEIVGAKTDIYEALCPSTPLVLDYLRQAVRDLFAEVPELGGIIDICKGERPTTCWWWSEEIALKCPRCGQRPHADVIGQTLNAFMEGMRMSSATARFIAWPYLPYAMDKKTGRSVPLGSVAEMIEKSDPEVIWLGNFEHGGIKQICGKPRTIHEYSLSSVEAGSIFKDLAEGARVHGREAYAKLQIGTTYELSSVPGVPVPGVVYDKFAAMQELGATGTMLSWVIGGFPGPMLKAAGESAFESKLTRRQFLRRLAGVYWGETSAGLIASAWEQFAKAWQQYPFDLGVLYRGPLTRGPAYQLHLERESRLPRVYNWGFERDRQPQFFAYEPDKWLGVFSAPELIKSFRAMAAEWLAGLEDMRAGCKKAGGNPELGKMLAVAEAIRLHFLSAANVHEFYHLRDQLLATPERKRNAVLRRMRGVTRDEVAVAGEMKPWLAVDPSIGFESELFAYSYTAGLIDEKIRRSRDVLATLERWERTGVETAVLHRTVEEAERLRPDQWGD